MSWFLLELSRHNIPVPSTFVETGAYMGDGIAQYIQCMPFHRIHSIELSPQWANHCRQRFSQYSERVTIHEGDSASILPTLSLPSSPVLFYLDAHYSGGSTAGEGIDNGCPVLRELEFIARRNVSGDVIFVDDIRLMGCDSVSGLEGSEIYPVTRFDFRHVHMDAMKDVFEQNNRKCKIWQMCRGIDRLIIVLE
jgi:hypothetical protein